MVTIIDYNAGNIVSIKNMLNRLGVDSIVTSDPQQILDADKLILPGVGHFDYGMANLQASGLISILHKKVIEDKTPILGICLGVQLFTAGSEEGSLPGLGWFKSARTIRFQATEKLKIPHMGWSEIEISKKSKLFDGVEFPQRFYFVHSYHLVSDEKDDILATTNYGINYVAALEYENVVGVQFHPEKSHKYGLKLLKNFIDLY